MTYKGKVSSLPAMRGSIRGVSVISIPRPLAALVRNVSLEVSAKPLAKVRCNCGKNGFTNRGIFSSNLLRDRKMAPRFYISFRGLIETGGESYILYQRIVRILLLLEGL